MKTALIILIGLPILGIIAFFVLGLISQSGEARGLVDGKLSKCPDKPNCICTEYETDPSHYIEPIVISQIDAPEILSRLKNNIREMGGRIQVENDDYLAATFTSSIFRFIDDMEIRIALDQNVIHLRSASRVGYSDRSINKKRIERLKKLYQS